MGGPSDVVCLLNGLNLFVNFGNRLNSGFVCSVRSGGSDDG